MAKRGAIRQMDVYLQSKLLDHSPWDGRLPRKITPSDIDIVFDNAGSLLFCELKLVAPGDSGSFWNLEVGQQRLFQSLLEGTTHQLAILYHSTPPSIQIDTRNGINAFRIVTWEGVPREQDVRPGKDWPDYVESWFQT